MGRHEPAEPQESNPGRTRAGRQPWGIGIAVVSALLLLSVLVLATTQSLGGARPSSTSSGTYAPLLSIDGGEDASQAGSEDATTEGTAPSRTSTTMTTPTTTTIPPPPAEDRLFASTSPFNTPISATPILDPLSEQIAATLGEKVIANLYEFGIPVYEATDATAAVDVNCTKQWGTCLLESEPQRIPVGARPASGSDGTLVVIDRSEGRTVEMWQAIQRSDGSWSTSWGTTTAIDGTGIPTVFGNGAGVSHVAGVVRVDEIAGGSIDHALAFSSSYTCANDYRYPATKTDGTSARRDCIPEGARVQLDPSIDLEAFELSSAERTIAQALQTYGAYAIDTGGTTMAFNFEIAEDATPHDPGSEYANAGLTTDFFPLQSIPWRSLRVLSSWDGE